MGQCQDLVTDGSNNTWINRVSINLSEDRSRPFGVYTEMCRSHIYGAPKFLILLVMLKNDKLCSDKYLKSQIAHTFGTICKRLFNLELKDQIQCLY